MLEILTKSGAVLHVDPNDPVQTCVLQIAIDMFGGEASRMALTGTEEEA